MLRSSEWKGGGKHKPGPTPPGRTPSPQRETSGGQGPTPRTILWARCAGFCRHLRESAGSRSPHHSLSPCTVLPRRCTTKGKNCAAGAVILARIWPHPTRAWTLESRGTRGADKLLSARHLGQAALGDLRRGVSLLVHPEGSRLRLLCDWEVWVQTGRFLA